jgi:hypothetical protein
MADPMWRLCNLYTIKRADSGRLIQFAPRPEQMQVFDMLLRQKLRNLIILKARRLGMSTAIDLFITDQALWNAGLQASIVDQTAADAERKLATINKVALDNLQPAIRERIGILRDSNSVLEFGIGGDLASAVFAGVRARGGTNNILHLSEWGVIQADDPARSEEILTGALPSAEHGIKIVETTWKGGRGGHLYALVKQAQETPDEDKTEKDWRVVFFPWWTDQTYTLEGNAASIGRENAKYLADLEQTIGRTLTPQQKLWYDRQQRVLGLFIYREFPSTIDECFKAPVEGAIYADLIEKLRAAGAISARPHDHSALVHTCWDLGSPANTVTWYFQIVAGEIRVIDMDQNLDLAPVPRVAHMMAKGYPLGSHYLPHDAMATNNSGRTFHGELTGAGLTNVHCVPRTHDVWVGINRLRQLLPRFTFRLPNCEAGIDALSAYHKQPETSSGLAVDKPVHDWSSHASDALRILAEAEMAGLLKTGNAAPREPITVKTGFRGNVSVRR